MAYIDKDAVIAEIEKLVDKGRYHEEYDCAYRDGNNGALYALKNKLDTLEVKEVDNVWHNASEEPDDMSHCLIFYGCEESVGHYLHYEPVLYNKKEKMFVTSSFPHPTGYKVEQKSIDGGCVAEVYRDKRDRISISDITQWCYLKDLHNLSNVQRIGKEWKEPVSEDLEEASEEYGIRQSAELKPFATKFFKAGAEWQKNKTMKDAIDCVIADRWADQKLSIDIQPVDTYSYNLYDKVKLIIIKQEEE